MHGKIITWHDISSSEDGKIVDYALSTLSGKWKWIIIGLLYEKKVLRYVEIKNILKKPTDRTLSRQLHELEQDDIVVRTSYKEIPPRVEYSLTSKGDASIQVISSLLQWGKKYKDDIPKTTKKERTYW